MSAQTTVTHPPSEVAGLPVMLTPQQARCLLGCSIETIYVQTRNYIERIKAFEERTGERMPHDWAGALPRENEIAAVRLTEPSVGSDGRRRGGAVRIYRDLLLWKLYGVRDYGCGGDAA